MKTLPSDHTTREHERLIEIWDCAGIGRDQFGHARTFIEEMGDLPDADWQILKEQLVTALDAAEDAMRTLDKMRWCHEEQTH